MCTVRRGTQIESEVFLILSPESASRKEKPQLVRSQQVTSPEDR